MQNPDKKIYGLYVKVSETDRERLAQLARRTGLSQSETVRAAIRAALVSNPRR